MVWLDKVLGIFSNDTIGKTIGGILDKIPDAGAKAEAKLAWEKEAARQTEYITQVAAEENKIAQDALSARLQTDMASDSWLSKNIRPICLIFLLLITLILAVLDSANFGFTVKESWVSLYKDLLMAVGSFYFLGRSVEKIQEIRNR
jgi:hypothetical protein